MKKFTLSPFQQNRKRQRQPWATIPYGCLQVYMKVHGLKQKEIQNYPKDGDKTIELPILVSIVQQKLWFQLALLSRIQRPSKKLCFGSGSVDYLALFCQLVLAIGSDRQRGKKERQTNHSWLPRSRSAVLVATFSNVVADDPRASGPTRQRPAQEPKLINFSTSNIRTWRRSRTRGLRRKRKRLIGVHFVLHSVEGTPDYEHVRRRGKDS